MDEAGDPEGGLREQLGKVTRAEGFPTRAELIERYEERSGRSMSNIRWYTTLAMWKSVVFMEGNYKRAIAGTHRRPLPEEFGEGVLELASQAEEVAVAACQPDRRTALLIDWGGVLTTTCSCSFHATACGSRSTREKLAAASNDPQARELLIALENGADRRGRVRASASPSCSRSSPTG